MISTIEEVNQILAADDEGKKLLWTTHYPHNLKPEVAKKIQAVLKKKRNMGVVPGSFGNSELLTSTSDADNADRSEPMEESGSYTFGERQAVQSGD